MNNVQNSNYKKIAGAFAGALFLLCLVFVFFSYDNVQQSERGVLTSFGEVKRIADPGLVVKWPWETVVKLSIISHTHEIPLEVYSKDGQLAPTNSIKITYHLPEANVREVFTGLGKDYFENVLKNPVENIFREEFGKRTADQIISTREELNEAVTLRVKDEFKARGLALETVGISIRFNDMYNQSAEQSAIARVKINTAEQNLKEEEILAKVMVVKAQGKADSEVAAKKAESEGIRFVEETKIEMLKKRAELIAAFPQLLRIITAERWDGKMPTTMLPGNALPFIDLTQPK